MYLLKVSVLLRKVIFKNHGTFYRLNCLHSFATKEKLELHKKECKKKHSCNEIMPSEDIKILEFNQYQKSNKSTFLFMQILHL